MKNTTNHKTWKAALACLLFFPALLPAATISNVSSFSGPNPLVIDYLVIQGTDLNGVTKVEMNGIAVPFTKVYPEILYAQVPPPEFTGQLNGFVTVRSPSGDATSTQSVTVDTSARGIKAGYTWTAEGKFAFVDGANLQNATSATIDGVSVPIVQVNSMRVMMPITDFNSILNKTIVVNTPQGNVSFPVALTDMWLLNGIAPGEPGHFDIHISKSDNTGSNSSATYKQAGGESWKMLDVLYDYVVFVDRGTSVGTLAAISTITQNPTLIGPGLVESTGTFTGSAGQTVTWRATGELKSGSFYYTPKYEFSGGATALGQLNVTTYIDQDVHNPDDDFFTYTGTVADKNFTAYTIDGQHYFGYGQVPLTDHTPGLLENATYDGFSVGMFYSLYSGIQSRTATFGRTANPGEGESFNINTAPGEAPLQPADPNFPEGHFGGDGTTDVSSALRWTVNPSATTAIVTPFFRNVGTPSIEPVSVTGIVLPAKIGASTTGTGSLALTAPASTGGVVVNLTSNNSSLVVPATVTIPEGNASATFNYTTGAVTADTPVTVSALITGTSPAEIDVVIDISPKIEISGNAQLISSGDVSPSLTDHTSFGSTSTSGSGVVRTYTITNSGLEQLNLTGTPVVALSGAGAAAFSVSTAPASTTVAANGGTQTFQITFQPASVGTFNATVTLVSSDTASSPYSFAITGEAVLAPTVTTPTHSAITINSAVLGGNVTGDGGSPITERGVVYAPTATNGSPQIGGSGVVKVSTTGTTGVFTINATSLLSQTAYSYAAYATNSGATSYSSVGTFNTLTPGPEITVYDGSGTSGAERTDNTGTFSFGSVNVGASGSAQAFTLLNSGLASLTGLAVNSSSPEFTVNATGLGTSLAPNQNGSFTVTFRPAAPTPGPRSGIISITSNDVDETTFEINVSGTASPIVGEISFDSEVFSANQGAASTTVTVVRNGGTLPFSVLVSTANGIAQTSNPPMSGALAGTNPAVSDYVALNGTTGLLNFADGENSKTVTLNLYPKAGTNIPNKRFNVNLGAPTSGGTLGTRASAEVRIAAEDIVAPLLSVVNPAASTSSLYGTWPLRVNGWAGDLRGGVGEVRLVLNGGPPIPAIITDASNPKSMPWQADIEPVNGLNSLLVSAYDLRGNLLTVTRTFTFTRWYNFGVARVAPAGVPLDTAGTVSLFTTERFNISKLVPDLPHTSPSYRYVVNGTSVTLTATAQPGYVFSHWMNLPPGASVQGNIATLIVPASDTIVTAVFVQNSFGSSIGEGNDFFGTFGPANPADINLNTTGWITGTIVPSTGAFTAQIITGGTNLRQVVAFMGDGSSVFTTTAGFRTGTSLNLGGRALTLRYTNTGIEIYLDGTQVGLARRARYSSTNPAPVGLQGLHTVAMPAKAQSPVRDLATYPQGDGFGSFTTSTTGMLSYAGTLADGSAFTAATALVSASEAPFYAELYTPGVTTTRLGSFSGLLNFDARQPNSDVTGTDLLWIRPTVIQSSDITAAALATQLYTAGWPNGIRVDAVGARYDNTLTVSDALAIGPVDGMNGNSELEFSAGKLTSPVVVRALNISGSSVTRIPATNSTFSVVLTQSNGAMSGSFTPNWSQPSTTRPNFRGIVLQKGASRGGYGFFLSNRTTDTDPESGRATLGAP